MKKIIGVFGAALLCAGVLAGCGGQNDAADTENGVTVSTISLPSQIEEETVTVSAAEQTADVGDVTVAYPELSGFGEATAQQAANNLVQADMETFCKNKLRDKDGRPVKLEGALESTVIPHKETVSVVTTGIVTDNDGKKRRLVYTTNVSQADGSRVDTGVRDHAKTAAALILSGEAAVVCDDAEQAADILTYLTETVGEKKLAARLARCDYPDEKDAPQSFSYYMDADTDDIGVYVPVSRGLGSYALVLIRAEQLVQP